MICLSHFCELHGPCSIICTQVSQNSDDLVLKSSSKLQTCASCKLELPDNSVNLFTKSGTHNVSLRNNDHNTNKKDSKKNKNVSSMEHNDNDRYFISTQYPSMQSRYTSLTKLIMKSLSVETTSDFTKPLYLGDNVNGYGLTKVFKIKDINARGGERKYSLMVISDEEIKILKNWDVISTYINKIINSIQLKVTARINHNRLMNNNDANISNEHYLRRSFIKPKSLIDLTGDEKIYVKLHLGFIELIKDIR